ncbi:hypothetical protein ACEQ8H_007852 [Pleosporales sp. CAS-2024a]
MATQEQSSSAIVLPSLPAKHADWIQHVASHADTPLQELIAPYKEHDSKLREVFAQQPDHPAISEPNVVPVFAGHEHELKIRPRSLDKESEAERECYLMPLKKAERKPAGTPAVVQSLKEFQTNFQLFSESSLVDMDWSNVVVAGSAVVTSLLPVPEEHGASKRALREYYHQKLAPASDVDLFLYDLTEEQAVEKIKQIEQRIKDSILIETTTIRTKNAITIASQYPTRHVQIVLRIYRSISEILTGFDVDCSCAAYDGSQVYASPRALTAYMTQINTIDLTRRSPSYENRLSKYSKRGFEIHWPLLNRSRIDPTLFERSFGRTLGLARLLVLENLPKNTDRDAYVDQRRAERGRPTINRWAKRALPGNMKEEHDDEVAEWVETDEISDYHTFTIPYGPKYHAKKIERLLYAKDLLLNAEWNRPKDRETTLHRHPAFFGSAIDVIGDCCGYCPEPVTLEDKEIFEEETKTYVTGEISFLKDNPGRQAIGSFNPLTDDDWTEMAYVGNTARLCQAIVDGDLEHVQDWLSQEGADPNRRDYTGRTPLHLAVMASTPEIVQCLIDGGARIVARLVDGKTALHLAAMRGEAKMVKALLVKSGANEEAEAEKTALKRATVKTNKGEDEDMAEADPSTEADIDEHENDDDDGASDDSDIDMLEDESENGDATTEGSIIKVDPRKPADNHDSLPDNADPDEPDIYSVDVLAWDVPVSALHLAIANGHADVVRSLVQDFGADILLPIKLVHDYNKSPRAALLPIVLALQLSPEKAKEMTELLISLGASPAQADVQHVTALQYFTAHDASLLNAMIAANRPAAQRAVNHLSMLGTEWNPSAKGVLHIAIENDDAAGVEALLELGAKAEVDFGAYITAFKTKWNLRGLSEENERVFRCTFTQPVISAVEAEMTPVVLKLLDAGADVNTLSIGAWNALHQRSSYGNNDAHSLLETVRKKIEKMREFMETSRDATSHHNLGGWKVHEPIPLKADAEYLEGHAPRSYTHLRIQIQIEGAKKVYDSQLKQHKDWLRSQEEQPHRIEAKRVAVQLKLTEFEDLESQLLERGAKTYDELHPNAKAVNPQSHFHLGNNYTPELPKPWNPTLSFTAPDLTDERRAAYVRLFQACWDADLPTVKELTLAVWGDNQPPLRIAVRDSEYLSPFSIAVLRRHPEIARAIIGIAHAQYASEEKVGQVKHSVQPIDEDDDSQSDDENVQIYSEIVDDRFTVENIGEVQSQVKSDVTPLTLLSWACPAWRFLDEGEASSPTTPQDHSTYGFPREPSRYRSGYRSQGQDLRSSGRSPRQVLKHARNGRIYNVASAPVQEYLSDEDRPGNLFQFAIYMNDAELLHFLIDLGEDYTAHRPEAAEAAAQKFFRFAKPDLLYAIRLGRIDLLREIVKRTGSGIPFDDLVKKSGIVIPEKPKFYQGLSVHGQKRADWANAGRDAQSQPADVDHPPLLHAAMMGVIDSVEWLCTDSVLRCYSEFTNDHGDDMRIQNLAKTQGGTEATISKWLSLRSHLLLHCVVMSKTTDASLQLLEHLCKRHPDALEHRSASGMTPLQLAFRLHRVEKIKILIAAGAQQTCRNNVGDNILHSILEDSHNTKDEDVARIRSLLDLIDPLLLMSLFKERTTEAPGAATPLARWLHSSNVGTREMMPTSDTLVLKLLLEYSKGEDLCIISGEGDTPLHVAARNGSSKVLRIMLEERPDLLLGENATGRTPYEIAEDAYLNKEVFADPPPLGVLHKVNRHMAYRSGRRWKTGKTDMVSREPETFVDDGVAEQEERSGVEVVWELCEEYREKQRGVKRKLVSLVEASEVARRLVSRKGRGEQQEEDGAEGEGKEDVKGDEVDVWFAYARRYR